jgi:hypothetical protein
MKKLGKIVAVLSLAALTAGLSAATAHDGKHERLEVWRAFLVGQNETPSISTPATGTFRAVIDEDSGMITYKLTYDGLTGTPLFAHIHFGERRVAGGVMVFLCGGPAGSPNAKPACPAGPAEINGTIMAADVVDLTKQGIAPGEFAKVLAAIREGAAYANVHTPAFGAGEIRGQLTR